MSLKWVFVFTLSLHLFSPGFASGANPIFPQPTNIQFHDGVLLLDKTTEIVIPRGGEKLRWVAEFLAVELGRTLGAPRGMLAIVAENQWKRKNRTAVFLGIADSGSFAKARIGKAADSLSEKQGTYILEVRKNGAAIFGRDAHGAYYGSLSLLQLFSRKGKGAGELASATIVDSPFHSYRGIRAIPPRGKPWPGEITHDYFRNFIRLLSYFRLNHVWLKGNSYALPLRRHPEMAWADVLTQEEAKAFDRFAVRHFVGLDGDVAWMWLYNGYKHLTELYPDETWEKMRPGVKEKSRLNPCPSNPETWKILYETMDDIMEVLSGDHFAIPLDEMYQENHGARWAVCPLCRGKDPVRLWADFASRLAAHVIQKGRVPVMGAGMLLREHQGWYKNIYQAIDMVENRDKIIIYNWSEGHIRRGAMVENGKRLQNPDLKTTLFFRQHGYKDVMHLLMERWEGRPEMREVNGKLDCYGGFVSYYHPMDHETMKRKGTLSSMVFSAQHLWSPDNPPMDSEEDRRMGRYGEALADAVLKNKSFMEAVLVARWSYFALEGPMTADILTGRWFETGDPPVDLSRKGSRNQDTGKMRIDLPVEEANPRKAYLVLTINGWDKEGVGEIYLNGHKVEIAPSKESTGRNHRFPPIAVPPEWLKFGSEPNVLQFTRRSAIGFKAVKAAIVVSEK